MKPFGIGDRRMVGGYQLIAELGQGAMGQVFLALGQEDTLVALKQVHPHLVNDPQFRMRFSREVKAARRVSGDHTMAIVDSDSGAAVPWLASTFAPGLSLEQALEAGGAFTEQSTMRLALGLAKALIDIKEAKLVHRDLKPSNIMLTEDGPRVIDFGIARAADGATLASLNDLTRTKQVVGTAPFMSPEQAEARPLTAASDIFSLGSVLATAVTGKPPFSAPSEVQILYKIVHSEPDLTPLPLTLRGIVQACLAKDPNQRPSAEEIVESLSLIHPTVRPWSAQVHSLIDTQDTEVAQLVTRAREWPTRLASGGTKVDKAKSTPVSKTPVPVPDTVKPGPKDSSGWTALLVILAVIGAVAFIANLDDDSSDSSSDSTSSSDSVAGDYADDAVPENDDEDDYTTDQEEVTEAPDNTLDVCSTATDTMSAYIGDMPSSITEETYLQAISILGDLSDELYDQASEADETSVQYAIEALALDYEMAADALDRRDTEFYSTALGWAGDDLDEFDSACYGT